MANADTKVLTAHIPLPLSERVDQLAPDWNDRAAGLSSRRSAPGLNRKRNAASSRAKRWPTWMPAGSSIIRQCRHGPIVSAPVTRCRPRWIDGIAMDQQGLVRSNPIARVLDDREQTCGRSRRSGTYCRCRHTYCNPRVGERLDEFEPHEIQRIQVGRYELRYETAQATIYILRLWHTREER